MLARPPDVEALYRAWYAAAGPWAGYFRAVPLVAAARGVVTVPARRGTRPPLARAHAAEVAAVGREEGWLGRADVLLVLDLPGPLGVWTSAALAEHGVRPVLLVFQWPGPAAVVPSGPLLAALAACRPPSARAGAQYAFVLARERNTPIAAAALTRRFDNRYELGLVDLPAPERLEREGIGAVVAARPAAAPIAADLASYLETLTGAGWAVRDLPLGEAAPAGGGP